MAVADSISRIASALDSAKELTSEVAAVASSRLGETSYTHYSKSLTADQLRNLLNSRYPGEVKDGLKRVVALMASDDDAAIDVQSFFADVVKNIVFEDLKIKRLVCIYLLRYAELQPNLTLLSVNSIQKTLNDPSPEARSFTVKALSDIKLPSIYPIILHSLKKAVNDTSPLVRNEVSFAVLKLLRYGATGFDDDISALLKDLLADSDPKVISSAVILLSEGFPNELALLHGHFRRYCRILPQLDTWSQRALIELLIRYCKTYLPRPKAINSSNRQESILLTKGFNEITFPVYEVEYHPDLSLFLESLRPLVYSTDPAVIRACTNAFYQLSTAKDLRKSRFLDCMVKFATSTTHTGVKNILLKSILFFANVDPSLVLPYFRKFLLFSSDTSSTACLKLKILGSLINDINVKLIFKEVKCYIAMSKDNSVLKAASEVLAICGQVSSAWKAYIMQWLILQMRNKQFPESIMESYSNLLRLLVQEEPEKHLKIVVMLSELIQSNMNLADSAKAGIIWLFGEIANIEPRLSLEVLRRLVPNFAFEGRETRSQILLLSAKVLSHEIDQNIADNANYDPKISRAYAMYDALISLARYDDDFSIRDRARALSSLFDSGRYQIATLLLQVPKPLPNVGSFFPVHAVDDNNKMVEVTVDPYYEYICWNTEVQEQHDGVDIRKPLPIKDYSKSVKSFSSESFMSNRSTARNMISGINSPSTTDRPRISFTSQKGRQYKLQSLDEFFADIPAKRTTSGGKKRIIIQESSEDDSEEEEDEEEEEEEEESSPSSSCEIEAPPE